MGRLTPGLSEQGGEARLLEVPVAEVSGSSHSMMHGRIGCDGTGKRLR